jgi:hypothetical protein
MRGLDDFRCAAAAITAQVSGWFSKAGCRVSVPQVGLDQHMNRGERPLSEQQIKRFSANLGC